VHYSLIIDFLEAAAGGKKRLTMPDGKSLDLTIPEGIADGQVLRLRGQGGPGYNGGPNGDAFVEIHIAPHPLFERRDKDIHIELPITLAEAVLGGKIEVPTVRGPVSMTVPKWSNTGTVLRLRGRGIRVASSAGDEFVTLKIVLPDRPDPELERLVEAWAPTHKYDPRASIGSAQ
jgi:DnaJ-class molecular chaperone